MALAQVNSLRSLCSILLVVPWDQQMLAFLSTPTQCLKSQGKLSFRCYTLRFEDKNDSTRSCGLVWFSCLQKFAGAEIRTLPCTACSVSSVLALCRASPALMDAFSACGKADSPRNAPVYLHTMPVCGYTLSSSWVTRPSRPLHSAWCL